MISNFCIAGSYKIKIHIIKRPVLIRMSQLSHGSIWDGDEVFLLIGIGTDEKSQQQLNSRTRKKPIFDKWQRHLKKTVIRVYLFLPTI